MNATLIQSKFRIPKKNSAAAFKALAKWLRERGVPDEVELVEHIERSDVTDGVRLLEVMQIFGYDLRPNSELGCFDRIMQRNFDTSDDGNAHAFSRLLGLVEPGSYMLFHRDDENLFRWRWGTDGLFHVEENGLVTFGVRDSQLVEIRATLHSVQRVLTMKNAVERELVGKSLLTNVKLLLKELGEPNPS